MQILTDGLVRVKACFDTKIHCQKATLMDFHYLHIDGTSCDRINRTLAKKQHEILEVAFEFLDAHLLLFIFDWR